MGKKKRGRENKGTKKEEESKTSRLQIEQYFKKFSSISLFLLSLRLRFFSVCGEKKNNTQKNKPEKKLFSIFRAHKKSFNFSFSLGTFFSLLFIQKKKEVLTKLETNYRKFVRPSINNGFLSHHLEFRILLTLEFFPVTFFFAAPICSTGFDTIFFTFFGFFQN